MKDAGFFEFPGSGIVQFIIFAVIVTLKVFDIWESSWLVVLLLAFVGSAIITGIVSVLYRSDSR